MSKPDTHQLYEELRRAAIRYALSKYNCIPLGLSLLLPNGQQHTEPIRPLDLSELNLDPKTAAPAAQPQSAANWASGPEPRHLSDFQSVYWPSLGVYRLSPKQARIVEVLWEARFGSDNPDVDQATLLRAADSDCTRLLDLFRSGGKTHPAWGKLVVPGESPATFRLPEPPAATAAGEG